MTRRGVTVLWPLALAAACSAVTRSDPGQVARPAAGPSTVGDSAAARVANSLREAVRPGSIVADVQAGRNPPMAVGACLDPVAAARGDLDPSVDDSPDRPPRVEGRLVLPRLPAALRDSAVRTGRVVARWVVDTDGSADPGTVSIVASPHGLLSVQVCGAVIAARFTPAVSDRRRVRARVEMPVAFVP